MNILYKNIFKKARNKIKNKLKLSAVIEGDNLAELKIIEEQYVESFDFIRINPPYNTRNKDMRYNDFFHLLIKMTNILLGFRL